MHKADLNHDRPSLQQKLQKLYGLRRTRSAINWHQGNYIDLLAHFGNPHFSLPPAIHVAGTNGKGSVVAMLRAIYEAQGYRVHTYTSPHLIRVNERICLAGRDIDDDALETMIDKALDFIGDKPMSFFEVMTAIAFRAFVDTPADILLLEVGMGGRLDCTNIVPDSLVLVSVINRISCDHTEFLGDTIEKIATEKAGIMRKNIPCVIGEQTDRVLSTLKSCAEKSNTPLSIAQQNWKIIKKNNKLIFSKDDQEIGLPYPNLAGDHQIKNAGVALAAVYAAQKKMLMKSDFLGAGLGNIRWRGRLQKLDPACFGGGDNTEIWLDCGHNDSAGEVLAAQIRLWKNMDDCPLHFIMAMLDKKDTEGFLKPLCQYIDHFYATKISADPTSVNGDILLSKLHGLKPDIPACMHDNVIDSIRQAIHGNDGRVRILIAGSVYLAGEVLVYTEK